MNPICVYHKSDLDGVCSAAIVKHFVPECELYGMEYGDEFPWETVQLEQGVVGSGPAGNPAINAACRRTVYLVDFNLPPDDMKRLTSVSNLIWIDHHKTAIEALDDLNLHGHYIEGFGACELAYHYFMAQDETGRFDDSSRIPEAVRLLGAYDSYRKDDPEWDSKILPFQYGCRSLENIYDPTSFDWRFMFDCECPITKPLVAKFVKKMIEVGAGILRFQSQQNRKIAEAGAFETYLEDPRVKTTGSKGFFTQSSGTQVFTVRCICLNTPLFSSQSFEGVWDPEKHDVMVAFAKMATGKWKVSLYSTKPEVDCGAIAKTFGGGGHKSAAGFLCDRLPWEVGNDNPGN